MLAVQHKVFVDFHHICEPLLGKLISHLLLDLLFTFSKKTTAKKKERLWKILLTQFDMSSDRPMSLLESLAPDTLLHIIDYVDHEDIQNFALCCPKVWSTAKEAFDTHKRRRVYHTVRLGAIEGDPRPPVDPIDVLLDGLKDNGLEIYPKEMIIGGLETRFTSRGGLVKRDPPLSKMHQSQIRSLVKSSRYHTRSWEDRFVTHDSPLAITCLLLTLFPNLRTIEFRNNTQAVFYLGVVVQEVACTTRLNRLTIAPQTNNPSTKERRKWDPGEPHALRNLTDLKTYHDEGAWYDFGDLARWAWLPSLRSIQCKGVHRHRDREVFKQLEPVPLHQSEVTRLELEECVVIQQDFETLLKSFKGLRYFKYHYGARDKNLEYRLPTAPWNPRGLIEILSTHASHSLVTLELTRTESPHHIHGDWLAGRVFVGSLRRFQLLRRLRADAAIFTESELENYIMDYSKKYEGARHEVIVEQIKKKHKKLVNHQRHLVDLLPPSLEELVLCSINDSVGSTEVTGLFKDPPVDQEERVPRWNKVVFECEPPGRSLLKPWEDAGIKMYCLSAMS